MIDDQFARAVMRKISLRSMRPMSFRPALCLLVVAWAAASCGNGDGELLLGVTTSVQDSGLLDVLVERFEDRYNYDIKPVVGGSGQILEQGRRGELDVIMTHSPGDEAAFIAGGYGVDRTPVMQNSFLIAGPRHDPAVVGTASTMAEAFARIASGKHRFVSRGDGSGTHRREQEIWNAAGIDPSGEAWYTGSATGQGQNLLVANDQDAYTVVDSSTFVAFQDRLEIGELLRDDRDPNVYSVIRLNQDKLDKVNVDGGDAWLEFMTGEGQAVIAEFGREKFGRPLFETPEQ
jgi:tungstate transport system substrate-binding protein